MSFSLLYGSLTWGRPLQMPTYRAKGCCTFILHAFSRHIAWFSVPIARYNWDGLSPLLAKHWNYYVALHESIIAHTSHMQATFHAQPPYICSQQLIPTALAMLSMWHWCKLICCLSGSIAVASKHADSFYLPLIASGAALDQYNALNWARCYIICQPGKVIT